MKTARRRAGIDMTKFYGFPKANTGVMPECAKEKYLLLLLHGRAKFLKCLYDVSSQSAWDFIGDDDIRAFITTDIPL